MKGEHHFKIYKPYGFLSQFVNNEQRRKNSKKLLGELYDFPKGSMAAGRLDFDSEGLLIITTSGKFSYHITASGIEKEYYVQVDGLITASAIQQLQQGVEISINGEKYQTLACQARLLDVAPKLPVRAKKIRDERHGPTSWISITLTEGKFRQVKKMTSVVGFPTLRLVRYRIGNLTIQDMKSGQVEPIKREEL